MIKENTNGKSLFDLLNLLLDSESASGGALHCNNELSASADQLNSSYSLLSLLWTESLTHHQMFSDGLLECPSGTYYLQGLCEVCPIGTYQDEMGKTYCKTCPMPSSASTTENNVKQFLGLENQYFLIISASGSLIVIIAVVAIVSIAYTAVQKDPNRRSTERSISRLNVHVLQGMDHISGLS
uniref:Tyrosine-protein kinase ephrin type A/B receptor-like domain-containing protein n=1 Tax=Magallana gigas TaxID=29159 RepID=A0A8W8HXA4_MAGGI